MTDADDAVEDADEPRPATLAMKAAAGVVCAEAVALAAVGVAELFAIHGNRVALGVTNVVFFLLYGFLLLLCARALLGAKSWSRSPIVLTQLIELGVAWSFVGNGKTWVSALLALPAAGVLAVMLAPSTTQTLYGRSGRWGMEEPADGD